MNAKQKRFCDEYLIDLNATQAAIRAGYSPKTAYVIADENLKKPYIKAYVEQRMKERSERTNITQDEVIGELTKIAFSNTTDFVHVVTKDQKQRVVIKDTDELDDDQKAAIKSIKPRLYGIEIEPYDKLKALELLGRHLGMFTDKIEIKDVTENPVKGLTTEELKKALGLI